MNYGIIFNQILILFSITIIGFIGAKLNIIDEALSRGLSKLLINITLPCLIIASFEFSFSEEMFYNSELIIITAFIIMIFSIIISKILFNKFEKKEQQVLKFITIFSNCGFMGYPVASGIYGKEGLFYASIYNIAFTIMVWTYGVYLFSEKKDFKSIKKVLLNPALLSAAIGIFLFFLSVKLPVPVKGTLSMIGNMTTPISMMVVGASLTGLKFKDIALSYKIYYVSFIRLLFIPAVFILILRHINMPEIVVGTSVILTAMPGAALSVILAEENNGDTVLASKTVLISTVLSAVTIPIIILLL